jgi:hypothetical protein
MFCYLWSEATNPNEAKFGERWVFAGQDPDKEVMKRIKGSLGVRKDLFNDGTVTINKIWDVTDFAKKIGRYYKQSRVDDYIRPHIGYRKGTTGEVHELPPEEIIVRVNRYLASVDAPLPNVGLTAWQADATENVINAISEGKRRISAELCARFGKTIWAGSLIRETNIPLTIIATYVKTSFASFEKDFSSFNQFKDIILIDMDDDYEEAIDEALAHDKQVVAFLSLCPGSYRKSKIEYLFSKDCRRLLIVDEADFGAHKSGQAKILINAIDDNDIAILMTGTNADRAVSYWAIDHQLSVVYPELVMEKRNPRSSYNTSLVNFNVAPERHNKICDVQFFQMNLVDAVEFCRKAEPDLFMDDGIYLPCWTKVAAHPLKAKGFFTRMLQAVFEGKHGIDSLNADYQFDEMVNNRVAMMFLPGSITNNNMTVAVELAKKALSSFVVVPVYGEETSNYECEAYVKEEIEKARRDNKNVLILSARMAQRSFSVGEITELYLAYDSAENGSTIQKISRVLTPHEEGKIGRVVSLSFDPNRDDKFDALLVETALNYKKNRNIVDAKEAMRDVLKTVDIFRCSEDGAIKMDGDQYLLDAISRNSISRVTGKVANLTHLSPDELKAIADKDLSAFRATATTSAQKGKTKINNKKNNNSGISSSDEAKLIARARDTIVSIVENVDYIIYASGRTTIFEALDSIIIDQQLRTDIENKFDGLSMELVYELFDRGVINLDFVELQLA